jgi:hypothetical protein
MLMFRQLTETHAGDSHNAWLYHEFDDSAASCRPQGTTGTMNTSAAPLLASAGRVEARRQRPLRCVRARGALSMAGARDVGAWRSCPRPTRSTAKELDRDSALRHDREPQVDARPAARSCRWLADGAGSNKVEPSGGGPYASVLIGNLWFPWHDTVNALSL